MIGKLTDLETMGLVDGPGMRLVLFLAGCGLRCQYCHNPETWDVRNATRELTPEDVLTLYQRYQNYYGDTGGVTFSGGEPLTQPAFLAETLALLKAHHIHTAIDTAGGVAGGYDQILDLVDLVILDIKAVDERAYQTLTGQPMTNFRRFLDTVIKKQKPLWLRQVVVPGLNDDRAHVLALKEFIRDIPHVQKVELLPYHSLGKSKYARLGLVYPLADVPEMDRARCRELAKILTE